MGQKVNPHGLRVGVIKDWDSRWFANKSDFGDTLVEDYNVRKFIKKNLYAAGVPKIEIERFADKVRIHIHCAKPGVVIGRGGAEIEKLRAQLEKMLNKQVYVNIVEVKRAMKQSIGRTMRLGAKGIKTKVSGRLGGAEIARSESYHEGTIPLQTIRADIDYGFAEAHTTYGRIGVKVWIYKGEVLKGDAAKAAAQREKVERKSRDNNRGGRDDRRRRDNRNGDRRNGGNFRRDARREGGNQ